MQVVIEDIFLYIFLVLGILLFSLRLQNQGFRVYSVTRGSSTERKNRYSGRGVLLAVIWLTILFGDGILFQQGIISLVVALPSMVGFAFGGWLLLRYVFQSKHE